MEKRSKIKIIEDGDEVGYATLPLEIFYSGIEKNLRFRKCEGSAECSVKVFALRGISAPPKKFESPHFGTKQGIPNMKFDSNKPDKGISPFFDKLEAR